MAKKNGRPTFKTPNLENATPGFIVDELGRTREKIADLKKLEGIYKEALSGRVDEDQQLVEGEKTFNATIEEVEQMRFDSAGAKKEFGEAWYIEHSKLISFRTIRTMRKPS